jgi:hypothetical protein
LQPQLTSAENAAELAEWEVRRAEVRKLVTARLTGKTAAAMEKAVDSLAAALKAALDEDESIAAAVASFAPSLHRSVRMIQRSAVSRRKKLAGGRLRDLLPIDTEELRFSDPWAAGKCADLDRQYYGDILEELDNLMLVF